MSSRTGIGRRGSSETAAYSEALAASPAAATAGSHGSRRSHGGSGALRFRFDDDRAPERERVLVVERLVVGDAGAAGVDLGAAELLGRDVLAGRGLHQRRPAEEDRPGALGR